jgi:4-amino-4-deoxy-L-arabinose transferase-like glycosyltransferase
MPSSPAAVAVARRLAAPLAVVLLALTVRVSFQRSAEAYPRLELIRNRLDDQVLYDAWAKSILAGTDMDWPATGHEFAYWAPRWPGVFAQDPGYPFLLALFYRAFGFAYDGVRALQAALGTACALLTWALARRHVAGATALFCGLVAALYQPLVFYEATLLREPVATFLVAAALLAATRAERAGSRRRALLAAAGAGLLLGVAILIRSHLALPAAAAGAWLLAVTRRRWGAAAAVGLAAATALAVAPVVALNVVRSGGPAFISSAGPYNLFIGNVHDATGGPSPRYFEVKAQGPPGAVDLLAELLDDAARHRAALVGRQAAKAAALFGTEEVPDNLSVPMGRATSAGRWPS